MSKSLEWLFPIIIAPGETPAPDELSALGSALALYLEHSSILKIAFSFAVFFVNTMPLFSTGRTLHLLKEEQSQDYLSRLHLSRHSLYRSLVLLMGLPVKMIYYSREAEQERLGFHARKLKEEAKLRVVTRP